MRTKGLVRAGFAVGFGLYMGKFAGECVERCIYNIVTTVAVNETRKGNSKVQGLCKDFGIRYETQRRTDDKVIIGFRK